MIKLLGSRPAANVIALAAVVLCACGVVVSIKQTALAQAQMEISEIQLKIAIEQSKQIAERERAVAEREKNQDQIQADLVRLAQSTQASIEVLACETRSQSTSMQKLADANEKIAQAHFKTLSAPGQEVAQKTTGGDSAQFQSKPAPQFRGVIGKKIPAEQVVK